jgi:hypothetical protein
MKSIFVAAMIAAACSGVALTGEVKQNQSATAAAVKAQVMSDAEMGKVTAGLSSFSIPLRVMLLHLPF